MATVVYKCLKVLYDAIFSFSRSKYRTTNVCFPKVCGIHLRLLELQKSEYEFICSLAIRMKVKFNKYFGECRTVLATIIILDLSRKFEYVQFTFTKFYGLKAPKTYLAPIRNVFNNVFDYYEKELGM